MKNGGLVRDDIWTTQSSVGSEIYINRIKRQLEYFVKELKATFLLINTGLDNRTSKNLH